MPLRFPSLDIPESQKHEYSEAEIHSTLFEPDMLALGYPPRTSSQADGEYFREQRSLALRRLKSGRETGRYDGLYMIGNSPVVLCEIKRYDAIDTDQTREQATRQLTDYACSEDFAEPPPFLILYCGKLDCTRFFRLKSVGASTREWEELPELWTWEQVKSFHLRGEFAEEVVTRERLREILLHHLDRIEDDLRPNVIQAIRLAKAEPPPLLGDFGRWLIARPEALKKIKLLYERKVAEVGKDSEAQVAGEMVTQAALNYLNKVFFLNLCEDRHLAGFYRIMREFLPRSRSETPPATAAVFLGLLRRRIRDTASTWDPEDEQAYRMLRQELAPSIQANVIEQNSWRDLIHVAFDLASEHFPLVYREDAFDYFRPTKEVLADLVYDLSTKSFKALTNRHVGDIYQGMLSARRQQQSKLGAFYTPHGDVEYMVSKLGLTASSQVLDPCMGSGHFLDGLYEHLAALYAEQGVSAGDAYRQIVENQIYGGDIDSFALSLAAIRLFLLSEESVEARPKLYVHDMLLHSPERPQEELFRRETEKVSAVDEEIDEIQPIDEIEFDAVVGNPPYGARKPEFKKKVYAALYGQRDSDLKIGSVGTGDGDTYGMFFANGIERLREGGRLCLITNDSFRTLTTHAALRRYILDRCKIVEVLLTDTKHFEGVSFQFAGMAITTLEKCSGAEARASNVMRLIDYTRDPKDYWDPNERLSELQQEEYEALPETPFFVGVPREVLDSAKASLRVRDVARGRQGLITADDKHFLAGIDVPYAGLSSVVESSLIATQVSEAEKSDGIPSAQCWVPFAKGEGLGEYWKPPTVAIDWSKVAVAELKRRDALPVGTSRKPRFQNREYYFRSGLTYSVVSSAQLSVRLMPEGSIFSDKGSAIFAEPGEASELFLLGYLNSALATFFMKKIVNTTATAHLGYVEKLAYRRPSSEIEDAVVSCVEAIVEKLKADPEAEIAPLRDEIDDLIFDLFEIKASRDEIRHFYKTVGKAQPADEDQAASE